MTPHPDLPHLAGPGASVRQAMAAHFLRSCRHIVEIGGAGLPLTDFLTHETDSITVVDPKIPALFERNRQGRHRLVRHIPARFQNADIVLSPNLGVAVLGLSLKPEGALVAEDPALVRLLRGAEVVVLEYALNLGRAQTQMPVLLKAAGLRSDVSIDFTIADGVIDAFPFAARRLLVLKPST